MDRIILDHDTLKVWISGKAIKIGIQSLPSQFTLYLNPLLYLRTEATEKVEWSGFQQQTLNKFQNSDYHITSSFYLCDLAPEGIYGYKAIIPEVNPIHMFKNKELVFQASQDFPMPKIQSYLKRFGVIFEPLELYLKQPFIKIYGNILSGLKNQQKSFRLYFCINILAVIMCLGLSVGVISKAMSWWQGIQELKQYQSHSLLSERQQFEAKLYQVFTQLTEVATSPSWESYEKFLKIWRSWIVATQVTYQEGKMSCHFVIHPDHQSEIDQIIDWVDQNLPGSTIINEGGENVEFHLSFAAI